MEMVSDKYKLSQPFTYCYQNKTHSVQRVKIQLCAYKDMTLRDKFLAFYAQYYFNTAYIMTSILIILNKMGHKNRSQICFLKEAYTACIIRIQCFTNEYNIVD